MSSDLKMEFFACYTFHKVWLHKGLKDPMQNIFEIYRDECFKDNSYLEVCDHVFEIAVFVRHLAFTKIYSEELYNSNAINWRSLSDCYDHVTRVCDRNDLFGHLTIFQRMFATFAYVLYLCESIYNHSHVDVVNFGHFIWAMYFDKYTEEFYEKGGWKVLQKIAVLYDYVFDFLRFLTLETETTSYLPAWKQASVNYVQFKKAIKYDISKYKHKSRIHVCKFWVKFHIEHFEEYIRIPLSYADSVDSFETEKLLHQAMVITKSSLHDFEDFEKKQEKFQELYSSKEMFISKIFGSADVMKTSQDLHIENLKTGETVCNEFPNSRKCSEIQFQSECWSSIEKLVAHEFIDETENVKKNSSANKSDGNLDIYSSNRCNELSDGTRNTKLDSDIEKSTKISDLNYETTTICSDSENEKYFDETLSRNEKRQCKLFMAEKASSLHHMDETQGHRKIPPENLPNPIDFYSRRDVSNCYNKGESSKSPLKSSFYSKNEEYSRNTEITCDLSTNLLSVSECDINGIPNKICTVKDFPDANNATMNGGERKKTITELNKLREEQADPEIRNFFRMILVLGDRQGIQYVCRTSCSGEEIKENSDVNLKKKKKRSGGKSRK